METALRAAGIDGRAGTYVVDTAGATLSGATRV
jgi:hypothetical protein